jgi:hypothetical protein
MSTLIYTKPFPEVWMVDILGAKPSFDVVYMVMSNAVN